MAISQDGSYNDWESEITKCTTTATSSVQVASVNNMTPTNINIAIRYLTGYYDIERWSIYQAAFLA